MSTSAYLCVLKIFIYLYFSNDQYLIILQLLEHVHDPTDITIILKFVSNGPMEIRIPVEN